MRSGENNVSYCAILSDGRMCCGLEALVHKWWFDGPSPGCLPDLQAKWVDLGIQTDPRYSPVVTEQFRDVSFRLGAA